MDAGGTLKGGRAPTHNLRLKCRDGVWLTRVGDETRKGATHRPASFTLRSTATESDEPLLQRAISGKNTDGSSPGDCTSAARACYPCRHARQPYSYTRVPCHARGW